MLMPSLATTRSAASLILIGSIICRMAYLLAAEETKAETDDFEELGLHYGKYLKEVVAALDKDQKFTETIKNMNSEDIKSRKVADQLKHVHEDVRKKLNDLKYLEIKRLRDLASRKNEQDTFGETYHGTKRKWRTLGHSLSELPDHLGSHDGYFDVEDLHKLMVAATNDLEKLDKERKEDFKTYEMEKEWQFQERLKMMNETEKAEAIRLRKELKEKHDNHAKVNEPGTRSQFEKVWEEKDHLPAKEFEPKTFFALHDTNSDNHLDPSEVKQLLTLEIQKLFDPNNPEDDPNEMEEEYERMREHVYKEIDQDKDNLISLKEFLEYSKKPKFYQDNGWNDVSQEAAYSKQEYENYQKNREQVLRNSHGYYDPSLYANQPQNLHLPSWGFGMPAGVNPAQYYGYGVDPNHPQAQHIAAQQHLAYQQAAYQQHAAAAAAGYQQPQYHQQAQIAQPGQAGQPPQMAQPAGYPVPQYQNIPQQQPPQMQQQQLPSQMQQQPQAQQQPMQQQQPPVQQQQPIQQQQPVQQQQPMQQPPVQQQQPMQQQQAIPPPQQQQQQQPLQQAVPPQQPAVNYQQVPQQQNQQVPR